MGSEEPPRIAKHCAECGRDDAGQSIRVRRRAFMVTRQRDGTAAWTSASLISLSDCGDGNLACGCRNGREGHGSRESHSSREANIKVGWTLGGSSLTMHRKISQDRSGAVVPA